MSVFVRACVKSLGLVGALAAGALAACSAPQSVSGVTDPCSLLTAAQIQDATGAALGQGVPESADDGSDFHRCTWQVQGALPFLEVWVATGDDFFQTTRLIADADGGSLDVAIEIAGADEAYQTPLGTNTIARIGDLVAFVGYISEGYLTDDLTDVTPITKKITAHVIANLPD